MYIYLNHTQFNVVEGIVLVFVFVSQLVSPPVDGTAFVMYLLHIFDINFKLFQYH